jgi:predicted nucleic acid-binding protein
LLFELTKHQEKLLDKLNLNSDQFLELKHITTREIRFIEEEQISFQNWEKAYEMTKIIDSDDVAFVALALELNCPLWTGDKKLSSSLTKVKTYKTSQLSELLNI